MKNALLIDLGGTNIRHAFFLENTLSCISKKKISDKDFIPYLSELLKEKKEDIDYLVVAAAGPNNKKSIKLTNRKLIIEAAELETRLNLKKCLLLNDWEAVAHALNQLHPKSFLTIKEGSPSNKNTLLIGPGTGLGVTLIIDDQVIPTEYGNVLSPTARMLDNFKLNGSKKFSSLESILSGPGIEMLYEEKFQKKLSSEEIIKLALHGNEDAFYIIDNFLKTFFMIVDDLVLAFSIEKIILGGSIMNSLEPMLASAQNYLISEVNPKYSQLIEKLQAILLLEDEPGIFGCLDLLKNTD